MSKIYHNVELSILSAIQLRSTGGEWAARPDENGVKNITVYDFAEKKRVPFIGDYINFKLVVSRKYDWEGAKRVDAGMYGQEIYFDLPINEMYANDKGRYEGLLNSIIPIDEVSEERFDHVFTQGFAFKNVQFDATLTEATSKDKVYYNVVRIEDAGSAKPQTKLDISHIKQSSNTASVLQAILAKRKQAQTPTSAAPTPAAAPVAPSTHAVDDIPFA